MEEEILWEGKPFNFGIPSFTKYKITNARIIIEKGIFTKRRDEIRLFRIRDVSTKRNLFERMIGIGDVNIVSTDASLPKYQLRNIRDSTDVADLLGFQAEQARLKHRTSVEVSEIRGDVSEW
ncbi:PH domain-containing protein [Numidum massiliense]|uniref:PH domain-containing protein n=1 Tax=Numidum massiliense TaxID=1522315 RepID=UPI0006D57F51|nr:PH domain-containing protein [Numidum massiliense]